MEKTYRSPGFEIRLQESGATVKVPTQVQILRTGSFFDPRYGQFEITPAMLAEMVKNFQSGVRGVDPAIDYAHESDKEAGGWIEGLSLREGDTQLWAEVQWTPTAEGALSEKKYRYLSADFHPEYQDNETLQTYGCVLLGAGLTNRPVIKSMAPIVELTELTEEGKKTMKTVQELQAENKKLSDQIAELEGKIKKLADAAAAPPAPGAGAGSGMTPEQMMAKIKELEAQIAALSSEKEMAQKNASSAQAQVQMAEKKAKFDKLLSEGKLVEAQREAFMAGDAVKLAELAGQVNLSARGSGSTQGGSGAGTGSSSESAQDQLIKLAEEKVSKDKKPMHVALKEVRRANPELAKKADVERGAIQA